MAKEIGGVIAVWMKKDLGNIPGIQWIDTPGHTGKDIVVNGKKCRN
jgi:glyoxylase-like metal-dependent hydrolase (beta-lactamase superfamily II)